MIMEEHYNKKLETKDDNSMKIFKILDYKKEKMHNDDVFLDSDNSNMKIFTMSNRNLGQRELIETSNVQFIGKLLKQNSMVISG